MQSSLRFEASTTTMSATGSQSVQALELEFVLDALAAARFGLCVIGPDERVLMMTAGFRDKLGTEVADVLGGNARSLLSGRIAITEFDKLIDIDEPPLVVEASVVDVNDRVSIVLLQARTSQNALYGKFRVISAIEVSDFGATPGRLQDLRRQLESLNSAVVISDYRAHDMPILYVNDRFKALTGYPPEEVIGRNCRFLQNGDTNQPALDSLRKAIAAGRGGYALLRNYRRNGEMFLNELLVTPIRDHSGNITHMVGMQREQSPRS